MQRCGVSGREEIDDDGGSVRVNRAVATVTATYTKQGREKENREPTSRLKKRIIRNECEIDDEGDSVRVNRVVATVTARSNSISSSSSYFT